jgi:class 3 adenylate cyclase/ABC-type branched-subunit amino acid transport system substrate-binding protein
MRRLLTAASLAIAALLLPLTINAAHYKVCGFNGWYGGLPWAMLALPLYSPQFPGSTFEFVILNSGDNLRPMVQLYLSNGSQCDVLTMVGYSPYALALSPVMAETIAWVDASATSTDLSNKELNPYFNRVIPTDAVGAGGAAVFVASQGWTQVNVLCYDDAYGRSVAEGFSLRLQKLGGSVEFSRCLSPTFTASDMAETLDTILSGAQSRVVFLAGGFGMEGIEGIRRSAAASRAILVFAESMCTTDYMSLVPGAFCATYTIDSTMAAAVQQAYITRDTATEIAQFGPLLDYAAGDISYEIDFWAAMVVDSARAGMAAVHGYATANKTEYPTTAAYLHSLSFEGLTGFVSFDDNGDRVEAALSLYNSQPSASNTTVGELTNFAMISNGTVRATQSGQSRLFYGVDGGVWATSPASGLKPLESEATVFPYWVIAVIVVAAVLLLALAVASRVLRPAGRDSKHAPINPAVAFTVIFTDIQSSTNQWALNPEAMGLAVDQHHAVIRDVLRQHNGYEVKTIGDSFMVAFKEPMDAVRASVHIQQALFAAPWAPALDDVYRNSDAVGMDTNAYKELWSGLRVRVGVHTGFGSIKLDPVSQGYDYYGTVVNTAARVEGVGHGGQILLTRATYDAIIEGHHATDKQWLDQETKLLELGPQPLRGLDAPVELLQLLPVEFAGRQFGPLRLDVEKEVESDDDESAIQAKPHVSGAQSDSASSSHSNITPEQICNAAAKRANVPNRDVLLQFSLLKALYSTTPIKDRSKLVADLAKRWRVPQQRGALKTEREIDCMLARLAIKAAGVVAAVTLRADNGSSFAMRSGRPSFNKQASGSPTGTPMGLGSVTNSPGNQGLGARSPNTQRLGSFTLPIPIPYVKVTDTDNDATVPGSM